MGEPVLGGKGEAPTVRSYRVLQGPREIAMQTFEILIEKPQDFSFVPGQAMKFFIDGKRSRTLSMVSAPHEKSLRFAYRAGETPFKKYVQGLKNGDRATLRDPTGRDTVYPEHEPRDVPLVMLAGGIGITAFMAIIAHAQYLADTRRFHLLYANPKVEYVAFKNEIDELRHSLRLSVGYFLTRAEAPGYERGRFSLKDLAGFASTKPAPLYYIAGSEQMVTTTRELLKDVGVTDERVRFTEFTHYVGYEEISPA